MEVNIHVAIMLVIFIITSVILLMIGIRYSDKMPGPSRTRSKKKYKKKAPNWEDEDF